MTDVNKILRKSKFIISPKNGGYGDLDTDQLKELLSTLLETRKIHQKLEETIASSDTLENTEAKIKAFEDKLKI